MSSSPVGTLSIACFVLALVASPMQAATTHQDSPLLIHESPGHTASIQPLIRELGTTLANRREVKALYQRHGGRLIWHDNGRLTRAAKEMSFLIQLMAAEGSEAHPRYLVKRIDMFLMRADQYRHQQMLDLYLTDGLLLYLRKFEYTGSSVRFRHELVRLDSAISARRLDYYIQGLEPSHQAYRALKRWLPYYRQLAVQHQQWTKLPSQPAQIRYGQRHPVVSQVRRKLEHLGDLLPQPEQSAALDSRIERLYSDDDLFDESLEQAMVQYQQRHGLAPTGKLNKSTRRSLNVTPQQRLQQIFATLARWHRYPIESSGTYVLVNVPAYRLDFMDNGRSRLSMKVIVGKRIHRTPIFSSTIEQIVLNPSWTPPNSIIKNELIPKFQRQPNWFYDQDFRLYAGWSPGAARISAKNINWHTVSRNNFPYKLVQRPGPKNPLGKIKFHMPNRHKVYLHDTSAPSLFQRTTRAFSHGCIRLEKPQQLAELLLQEQGLSELEVAKKLYKLERPKTHWVSLPNKIPVHVVYWTAWVDDRGQLNFRNDLYGRDG